ncbi:MAG: DUF4159 domain-containing protein [Gammaproteobacteria bacterium]|nr:DUF4159 domain-containing protein [Gammaproteobacteria bacterium]
MPAHPTAGRKLTARLFLVVGALILAGPTVAQFADEDGITQTNDELWLTRIRYDSVGGPREAYYHYDGRWWERWETDFPQAEQNFAKRLNELTAVTVSPVPLRRRLTDPDLGDSPLIFMSDVGYMQLSRPEIDALRTYLANGGFLWVDDFWGDAEWASLERAMADVLPGKRWITLPIEHPIFHTVFDIEVMPQIPARDFARWGRGTTEPSFEHRRPTGNMRTPSIRAYTDDDGRLMVIATHNTDIADGWERESYGEWYFENFSTKSYRVGINVIVYALSH